MTVTTTAVLSGPYYPNGVAASFPFGFKVFDASDLRVFDVSSGSEIDYDASLYSVVAGDTSGSVTFAAPPASGAVLYIALDPSFTNNISFGIEEAFFPQGHNEGFDRSALRDQTLKSAVDRSFVVPLSPEARSAAAGKVPLIDPTGEPSFVDLSLLASGAVVDSLGVAPNLAPSQKSVSTALGGKASTAAVAALNVASPWVSAPTFLNGINGYLDISANVRSPAIGSGSGHFASAKTSDTFGTAGEISIGYSALGHNDKVGGLSGIWNYYGTLVREPGTLGSSLNIEVDSANLGTTVALAPTAMGVPGLTACAWLAAGGEAAFAPGVTVGISSTAIGVISNDPNGHAKFGAAITVGSNALDPTRNDVLCIDQAHNLSWYSGGSRLSAINGGQAIFEVLSATATYSLAFVRGRPGFADTQPGDTLGQINFQTLASGIQTQRATIYASMRNANSASLNLVAYNDSGTPIAVSLFGQANNTFSPSVDNAIDCGAASFRWANIRAGTGTIQTSDGTLKKNLGAIPPTVLAAVRALPIIHYQFLDAIAEKGNAARLHAGIIAQDLIAAFKAQGEDAFKWGVVGSDAIMASVDIVGDIEEQATEAATRSVHTDTVVDGKAVRTWSEVTEQVPAFDTLPVVDADGNPVMLTGKGAWTDKDGVLHPALPDYQDMITVPRMVTRQGVIRTEMHPVKNEDGSDKTILSVRYDELAMLMIAAMRP